MNLYTEVEVNSLPFNIHYKDHILFLGSCFSQNIGGKFQQSKLNAIVNPYGVLFNPMSIHLALKELFSNKVYTKDDLMKYDNHWLSLNHSTLFSSVNRDECLRLINNSIAEVREHISRIKAVVITFGSAWGYVYNETEQIVANCHKIPGGAFTKTLLKREEITQLFFETVNTIKKEYKDLQFLFTLSPVRHWKDGVVENNRSKATLLLAIHDICDQFNECHYFPSYEIVMDQLRDYRFYDQDLLHPNETAVQIIWEKLKTSIFDPITLNYIQDGEALFKLSNHKIKSKDARSRKHHTIKINDAIQAFEKKYTISGVG